MIIKNKKLLKNFVISNKSRKFAPKTLKKGIYMLGINAPKVLVKGEFARSVREKAIRSMKSASEGKNDSMVNCHWTYKFVE